MCAPHRLTTASLSMKAKNGRYGGCSPPGIPGPGAETDPHGETDIGHLKESQTRQLTEREIKSLLQD